MIVKKIMKMYSYEDLVKLNQGLASLSKSDVEIIEVSTHPKSGHFQVLTKRDEKRTTPTPTPKAAPNPRPVLKGG